MNRRRQKNPYNNKPLRSSSLSTFPSSSSILTISWVPLTLILLLYTTGFSLGESAPEGTKAPTDGKVGEGESKPSYNLTGNPQIDYIHDPNLPRELNGYNLSDYPFFSRVPNNINFSCVGLKDGFYASINYKCQVYHHCIYGTRHDFLCANFTAFDQKTFICQFVSEVDCVNSALFFHRNDALYPEPTTTLPPPEIYGRRRPAVDYGARTPSPKYDQNKPRSQDGTRSRGSSLALVPSDPEAPPNDGGVDQQEESEEEDYAPAQRRRKVPPRGGSGGGRRRCKKGRCRSRGRRPRPRPVYYYDYEDDYEDDEYYEEDDYYDERPNKNRRKNRLKPTGGGNKVASSKKVEIGTDEVTPESTTTTTTTTSTTLPPPVEDNSQGSETFDPTALAKVREDTFTRSRPPHITRQPVVPKVEKNNVDKIQGRAAPERPRGRGRTSSAPPPVVSSYDEYYDDDDQSESQQRPQEKASTEAAKTITTTSGPLITTPTTTTHNPRQRLYNFKTKSSTTAKTKITRPTTTEEPTTQITTSPSAALAVTTFRSNPLRFSTSKIFGTPSSSPTTTTTTELPEYEYEYTYEDELPVEQSIAVSSTYKSVPTSPTTTTTTTTTQKPSRNNGRGAKRPYDTNGIGSSSTSIQTSTSVTVQDQESLQDHDESDASQNAINRRRSSWTRNQSGRTPLTTGNEITTPNSIVVTSEKFQGREKQNYRSQEPVITVKVAPSQPRQLSSTVSSSSNRGGNRGASESTELPVTKTRPSRFWQRPAKVVPSSTTTTETSADYADYSEEPETIPASAPAPVRYNANIPTNRYKGSSSSLSPNPTPSFSQTQSSSGSINDDNYSNAQYSRNPGTNNQYSQSQVNDNQFLRPTQNTYRQQSSTRSSIDHQTNYLPSSYAHSQASHLVGPTSSTRPEFISLLRDDEDPYYDIPNHNQKTQLQNPQSGGGGGHNRRQPNPQRPQYFGNQPYHQTQKNFQGEAQESYPSYALPPARYNSPNLGFVNDMNLGFRNHPQSSMMFIPNGMRNPSRQIPHMMFGI